MRIALTLLVVAIVFAGASLLPVDDSESPTFVSPLFHRAWLSEPVVAARSVDIWGSEPLVGRIEPYIGAPGDRRAVQYFERGRMEQQPGSSRVSHGRLVNELTSGEIDLGSGYTQSRQPPEIPIDSGERGDAYPTYLTLSRIVGEREPDRSRTREWVTEWLTRSGVSEQASTPESVSIDGYVPETGHNLPDVTTELFASAEYADYAWVDVFGWPISEPFWTQYRRNEEATPALIQVFERRILVYTPGNEFDRKFTVANSGRHYLQWRYGSSVPDSTALEQSAGETGITHPGEFSVELYAGEIDGPIDLELSITGHLLILTREGEILRSNATDPAARPHGLSVWARGISDPIGMVRVADRVLVMSEDGALWFRDEEGVGVPDERDDFQLPAPERSPDSGLPLRTTGGELMMRLASETGEQIIRPAGSGEPKYVLDDVIEDPGPIAFADRSVVLAGVEEDHRARVLHFMANGNASAPQDPVTLATFPPGSVPTALALADEQAWPLAGIGYAFVTVRDEDESRLFALELAGSTEPSEVIEVASGFGAASAMLFGLDGSLFVADADRGAVYRINERRD